MRSGTSVYLNKPPMTPNGCGHVDQHNGRSGTVAGISPDGSLLIIVLDGDHQSNKRWVHPEWVALLDEKAAAA
ncbi:MAG: hypothetical protein AAGA37_19910 [Actinomycetota bacterium]